MTDLKRVTRNSLRPLVDALLPAGAALLMAAATTSSARADVPGVTCPTTADGVLTVPSADVLRDYPPGYVLCELPVNPFRGTSGNKYASSWSKRRLIYVSTNSQGQKTAVSGTLVSPNSGAAGTLVAWDPGTFGIADKCAPSATIDTFFLGVSNFPTQQRVNTFVDQGWAVAVADYQGIGTSEEHPYLDGISAGRATLDLLRAVRNVGTSHVTTTANLFIAGISQGGNAAAWAAQLQPSYATELSNLRGVFAQATPAKPIYALRSITQRTASGGTELNDATYDWSDTRGGWSIGVSLAPYALTAVKTITGYDGFYGLDWSNDAAIRWKDSALKNCATEQAATWSFTMPSKYWNPPRSFFDRDNPENSTLGRALDHLNIGRSAPRVPVMLAHGDKDDVVPIALARGLVSDWCSLNPAARVYLHRTAGGTHLDDKGEGSPLMINFMRTLIMSESSVGETYTFNSTVHTRCNANP